MDLFLKIFLLCCPLIYKYYVASDRPITLFSSQQAVSNVHELYNIKMSIYLTYTELSALLAIWQHHIARHSRHIISRHLKRVLTLERELRNEQQCVVILLTQLQLLLRSTLLITTHYNELWAAILLTTTEAHGWEQGIRIHSPTVLYCDALCNNDRGESSTFDNMIKTSMDSMMTKRNML